jgi:hypothetical protein
MSGEALFPLLSQPRSEVIEVHDQDEESDLDTSWTPRSNTKDNSDDEEAEDWWDGVQDLSLPELREYVSRYLDTSGAGVVLDSLQALVTIVFAGLYVVQTYMLTPEVDEAARRLPVSIWIIEICCAAFLLTDWVFRGIFLADKRCRFLFSWISLVELLVALPVLPISFFLKGHTLWVPGSYWRLLYPLRFLKCYSYALRVITSGRLSWMTPLRIKVCKVYIFILTLLLIATGFLQIAADQPETFFDAFFSTTLIFGYIGYSDNASPVNKFFMVVFIIVLGIVVPLQIADVATLISTSSRFTGAAVGSSFAQDQFVVLIGPVDYRRLSDFLIEFFHSDHFEFSLKVVIFSSVEPSEQVNSLLLDPFYSRRVKYVRGSPVALPDLVRAGVDRCRACFLTTNFRASGPISQSEDAQTVVTAMAILKFFPETNLFVLLNHRSNAIHLDRLGIPTEQVICADSLRLGALSLSIFCPGAIALVYQLVHSFNTSVESALPPGCNVNRFRDFLHGCKFELYPITVSSAFAGVSFSQFARFIYDEFDGNALVFALQDPATSRLVLNPAKSYRFQGEETAFIISKSTVQSRAISKLPAPPAPILHQMLVNSGTASSVSGPSIQSISENEELLEEKKQPDFMDNLSSFEERVESALVESFHGSGHLVVIPCPGDSASTIQEKQAAMKADISALIASISQFSLTHGSEKLWQIVVLHHAPTQELVRALVSAAGRETVYVVRGNGMNYQDLERVNASNCAKALVIDPVPKSDSHDPAVDAEALVIVESLRYLCKLDVVLVELHNPLSLLLIGERNDRRGTAKRIIPLSSITGADALDSPHVLSPSFTGGHCFIMGLADTALCHMFYNPYFLAVLREMINVPPINPSKIPDLDSTIQQSYLGLREMPSKLIRKAATFGDLFYYCTSKNVGKEEEDALIYGRSLPLGLYRKDSLSGLCYSYLLPPPETLLTASDRFFVLVPPY